MKRLIIPLSLLGSTGSAMSAERPNILYILADDLGYGDVSCFNEDKKVMTPNIDKLASEGVMMTQAYAYPVSGPTRSSFITGCYGHEIGVYGNVDSDIPGVGPERPTFTPKLQELGYSTAWFGKWHLGYDIASNPLNNGFDRAFGFLGGMHDFDDAIEGSFYNGGPYSHYSYIYDNYEPIKSMDYLTVELTNQAIDFIEQQSDSPFYIYLAYNSPHTPLQAPEREVIKYLKQGHDAIAATRYAMIDVMDQQIGRVMQTLEDRGIADDTIVIFMSDNGPEKEENSGGYRGHKFTIWEGGIRSPMVVRYPGVVPAGERSNSLCAVSDLATTFLTVANKAPMSFGTGADLMPYFTLQERGNVRDTFIVANNPTTDKIPYNHKVINQLMVRDGDWKYVKDVQRGELGLYNIKEDGGERNNLYKENPQIVARMLKIADNILLTTPANSARWYSATMSKSREKALLNLSDED